ncbi:autotransporter adhesin BpaC-like isoform X2 [Nematostella vectensis]|uniref:autotransporter adhesin BpaC-like isoform X2 n=1 Tax=Nematostella vectensis TaxID=45351 RepID=UPI0020772618|nr:autotransporter adhesin BpaC-like isoform X2 [Nematostella vectensis]
MMFLTIFTGIFISSIIQKTSGFQAFAMRDKALASSAKASWLLTSLEWYHCLLACQENPRCVSYNYRGEKQECELSTEGLLAQCDKDKVLHFERGAIFNQIRLFVSKIDEKQGAIKDTHCKTEYSSNVTKSTSCTAEGTNSTTGEKNSTTEGANNTTGGLNSTTEGKNSTTGGTNSTIGGTNSTTGEKNSTTEGANNTTGGLNSTTEGKNSTTRGTNSTIGGTNSTTAGTNNTTGSTNNTTGETNNTTGETNNTTGGLNSTTEGKNSTTGETNSTTGGAKNTTGGLNSTTEGKNSTTGETNSTTGGAKNTTGGLNSTTGGTNSAIGVTNSTTGGTNSTTGGTNSTTGGTNSTIGGTNSTTRGTNSTTGGTNSTTGGTNSTSGGTNSTSGGTNNTTSAGATETSESNKVLNTALAYYPLNEFYQGRDISRHSNHSSYVARGVTYATGPKGMVGGAMEFDHSRRSYLALLNSETWGFLSESMTIAFWVHIDSSEKFFDTPLVHFFYRLQYHDNDTDYKYWGLRLWHYRGQVDFEVVDDTSQVFSWLKIIPVYNTWQFVVASYNKTGQCILRVGDVSLKRSCLPGRNLATFQGYVRLGEVKYGSLPFYFHGRLACLMFFDYMLDDKQIEEIQSVCA